MLGKLDAIIPRRCSFYRMHLANLRPGSGSPRSTTDAFVGATPLN
jgi:hypothetical protein